jgi:hypothetical protein
VGSGTGSGGQILSGIGTIASGLRIGGGAHGDTGMLMAPTLDLKAFVACAVGGPGKDGQKRRRDKKKDKESADAGAAMAVTVAAPVGPGAVGLAYFDRDCVVAGSVKALWTGRVADLVKMREDLDVTPSTAGLGSSDDRRWLGSIRSNSGFERDWKHREHRSRVPVAVASDGDADDHPNSYDTRGKRYDGRSTEEESDVFNPSGGHTHTFSGMWGGKMRGKLGNWAAYVSFLFPFSHSN